MTSYSISQFNSHYTKLQTAFPFHHHQIQPPPQHTTPKQKPYSRFTLPFFTYFPSLPFHGFSASSSSSLHNRFLRPPIHLRLRLHPSTTFLSLSSSISMSNLHPIQSSSSGSSSSPYLIFMIFYAGVIFMIWINFAVY